MKQNTLKISVLILVSCVVQNVFANDNNKGINEDRIVQILESTNVQNVLNILPNVENLWPQRPELYFQSVKQAAGVLGGSTDKTVLKLALKSLFANMIQKPFPTNNALAVSCVKLQSDTVLFFLNFDEVRNDKVSWTAIAKYIGELRSQIIPNFTRKEVYLNVGAGLDASSEEAKKAIEENEKNIAINSYQQSLRTANTILTFQLLHNANRFPSSNPTNVEFLQTVISSAHLTAEEQRQLQ